MPSIIRDGREICHPLKITKNKKQEKYCDGLDCAYCLDVDCPKTAIIFDGVNVRHCQYYRFEKCSNTDSLCSVNRYCYYKELQREIKKNKNLIKISDIRQETIIKLARRKKRLEQALKIIKDFVNKECSTECNIDFCKGSTDETTCVIYKIKNTIDEVLCAIQ